MGRPVDYYAKQTLQNFMDANDLSLEEAVQEAGQRVRGAGRCYAKSMDAARLVVQFVGMDPAKGLVRGDRSKIRESKRLMKEAREDLDRMVLWDSVLKVALAMLAEEGRP